MYKYSALQHPASGFRLFRLEPEEVDASSNRHEILIDNARFITSETVQEALFRLRRTDETRQLWIDQICIDQSLAPASLQERGKQVRIMGRTYRNSRRTIIWLGANPAAEAMAGIRIIQSFGQLHRELLAAAAEQLASIRAQQSEAGRGSGTSDLQLLFGLMSLLLQKAPAKLAEDGIPAAAALAELDHNSHRQILHFYQSDYFLRTWPVQEIMLSKDKVVYCGEIEMNWDLVGWFASWFMHQDLNCTPQQLNGVEAVMWVYSYAQTYTTGFPLATMLRTTRRFDATDPRDKVYALIGVVDYNLSYNGEQYHPADGEVRAVPDELDPDYSKEVSAVAVEPIFDGSAPSPAADRGPSWVPRWNVRENVEQVWLPHAADNFSACTLPDPNTRCRTLSNNGQTYYTCAVHGRRVATIADVVPYDPRSVPSVVASEKTWMDIADMVAHTVDWGTSGGSRPIDAGFATDISLVLTAGRAERGTIVARSSSSATRKTTAQHTADCADLLVDIEESGTVPEEAHLRDMFRSFVRYLRDRNFERPGNPKQGLYAQRCHSVTRGKTLFRTESGMLGLGPCGIAGVRTGDEVLALAGGRVPFVARPALVPIAGSSSRHLVGECYLPGAMDREFEDEVALHQDEYVFV
ncbi:heterokaryon incompatibility protein-domain-containing protein [Coniochaeta sp. 2T2.1]|nr:heterokaryon incompatibility protein-domain-containing protein [Coniochaeta sp. 2T2.1]